MFLVRGGIEEESSCPLLPQAQRLVKETRKRVARGEGKVCMQGKLASNFLPGLPLSCTDQQAHPAALGTVGEEILARTQQILSVVCERGVWCPLVTEKYNESERLKSTEMPGKEIEITPTPIHEPRPPPPPRSLQSWKTDLNNSQGPKWRSTGLIQRSSGRWETTWSRGWESAGRAALLLAKPQGGRSPGKKQSSPLCNTPPTSADHSIGAGKGPYPTKNSVSLLSVPQDRSTHLIPKL